MVRVGWKLVDSPSKAVLFSRKAGSNGCIELTVLIEMQFVDHASCEAFASQELVLRLKVGIRNVFQLKKLFQARNVWIFLLDLQQGTCAINRSLFQGTDQRQCKKAKYDREDRPASLFEDSPVDTEIPGLLRKRDFVRLRQFWTSVPQNRGNRFKQLNFLILRHIISCRLRYPSQCRPPLPRRDRGRSAPYCLERRRYPWAARRGQAVFPLEICRD